MASPPTRTAPGSTQYGSDDHNDSSESAALLENVSSNVPVARAPTDETPETENPNRPKGFRFAVVFACILLGDFFVGYVGFSCNHVKDFPIFHD